MARREARCRAWGEARCRGVVKRHRQATPGVEKRAAVARREARCRGVGGGTLAWRGGVTQAGVAWCRETRCRCAERSTLSWRGGKHAAWRGGVTQRASLNVEKRAAVARKEARCLRGGRHAAVAWEEACCRGVRETRCCGAEKTLSWRGETHRCRNGKSQPGGPRLSVRVRPPGRRRPDCATLGAVARAPSAPGC